MFRAVARAGTFFLLALGLAFAADLARPLPSGAGEPPSATTVLDRQGVVIAVRDAHSGRATGFGRELRVATLAAEDHRFHRHLGIDPVAVVRAVWVNLRAGQVEEGASTLSQQLARNLAPRGPGWRGKLDEARLALRLEAHWSKDEILRQYLARVYYGNGAVGADAAAHLYFDRGADRLSLAQAATLAAIPRRPADLDPILQPERVREARDRVLDRLLRFGLADPAEVDLARAEPLQLHLHGEPNAAPHLVRRVFRPTRELRTTLDLRLQRAAEASVVRVLGDLAGHDADHAAVIVVENRTLAVRAYVGSGRWGAPDGQVDGVSARRSPGSALKPFVYELALEEGATLADLVDDAPGHWKTTHGSWRPANYGGHFRGLLPLREALATSLNLPAVRVAEQVGVADIHRRLSDLGLSTLGRRPDHYGLGIALGDAEVRLDELVGAYVALGRGGRWAPLRFTEDSPKLAPAAVMEPAAAWLILDALDDPDARTAAFGFDSALEPDYALAAKTGTSTGYRDNWALGVSPYFTVGVWVGNFDGRPMREVSGITGAGPILRELMDAAMADAPRDGFPRPPGLDEVAVCTESGRAAGRGCPVRSMQWFAKAPGACTLHGEAATPAAGVGIASPPAGARYWFDPRRPAEDQGIPLRAQASGSRGRWLVDGQVIAQVEAPFNARWVPTPGPHEIRLEVDGVPSPPVHIDVATSAATVD